MVCKRQEQCKFGKMCGWAKDEETLLTECVEFIERVPLTNEEWLRSCNTEQLAEEIYECVMTHPWHISKEVILEWLKQPRKPIS